MNRFGRVLAKRFVKTGQFLQAIKMLNLNNYRSSSDYREILRILQKASTEQENLVWQSHALGKNIIPLRHVEIDFVAREVVIYFDTQRYVIDSELPLYVKLDYRTSVFKVSQFRQGLNSIHFPFPPEIKTQELRGKNRHQFIPGEERLVTMKPSLTNLNRESSHELKVRVMDVSETGMGLIVSEHNRSFLKNNRILWLTQLNGKILEYPILVEVVYINSEVDPKFVTRKQKDLKVGVKLSETLTPELYQEFIQ